MLYLHLYDFATTYPTTSTTVTAYPNSNVYLQRKVPQNPSSLTTCSTRGCVSAADAAVLFSFYPYVSIAHAENPPTPQPFVGANIRFTITNLLDHLTSQFTSHLPQGRI